MVNYVLEESNGSHNIFLTDKEYDIKVLVAVVFDVAHARIIVRKMNEYVDGLDKPIKRNA